MTDRRSHLLLTALSLLTLGAAPPASSSYPARADELSPRTRAICEQAATARPPAGDWPSPAEERTLKGCSSEALYYGIGRRADPVKARKCALLELRVRPTEPEEFSGAGLLMMIYANGRGARRDIDLAIHMQCAMTAAPVDTDTLVKALAARKASGARGDFDYCAEVEQGYSNVSAAACYGLASRQAEVARRARVAAAVRRLSPKAQAAYRRLEAPRAAFIAARISGEHRDGVIHRSEPVAFTDEVLNADAKHLQQLATGQAPRAGPGARAAAERRLEAQYRTVLQTVSGPDSADDLKPDGLRRSQAAWAAYRDAWLTLARSGWPQAVADGVAKNLADQRTDMLRCLVFDDEGGDPELEKLCS